MFEYSSMEETENKTTLTLWIFFMTDNSFYLSSQKTSKQVIQFAEYQLLVPLSMLVCTHMHLFLCTRACSFGGL